MKDSAREPVPREIRPNKSAKPSRKELDMTARCGRSFAGSLTLVAAVSVIPVAPSFAADKVSLAYTQTLY